MRADVTRDWGWADGYMPEIRRILTLNAVHLVSIEIASFQQDVKQATDMLFKMSGETSIALRLRRPNQQHRDLTIRAHRRSGVETELSKLKAGHGDYYLYGWINGVDIPEWMLINLSQLRQSGLLNRSWSLIPNKDRVTGFIAIPYMTLRTYGCITNSCISTER